MRKFLLILMGFLLMVLPANAETISFDATSTGGTPEGSYLQTAHSFIKGGVKFEINQFNPNTGQMKVNAYGKKAFTFYNTTAISGLKEVRITHTQISTSDNVDVGTIYMQTGTAQINGAVDTTGIKGITTTSGDNSITTFTVPEGMDVSFFKIQLTKKGKGTVKASKFEIDYGGGTGETVSLAPSINDWNSTTEEKTINFTDKVTVKMTPNPNQPDAVIYYVTDPKQFYEAPQQSEQNKYTDVFDITETTYVTAVAKNGELKISKPVKVLFTRKKVVPSTPVVTWTLDGVNHTAENDSTYNVYAGTQVTVTSENADKIVVTDSESSNGEYNAPYTFTVTADEMFTFAGKNADGTSSGITVMYKVVERPAENVYTLITDASQLKAGNKYVIAVKEQNMALSNQGNWNEGNNQYRKAVGGTQANAKFRIDENNVLHDQTFGTSSKEGIMVFTLGGSAGKWTLKADNYILSTAVPREGELETGEWVKLYVTDEPQPFFAMTTEPSENTISIAPDGSATITNSNSTGYVMKYMGTRFGMSKVGNNGFPLVQLYGCVPQTKPEMPVVTYTKTIDGENVATEDCGEYTAINGSKITVTSKNATRIDINGTKYAAVNGTYSFTTDVDRLYIIKGVNEANEESAEYTLQIYVDYEAATIPEMHTLSQKQKDRTDKSLWAPVKFTGYVFIRGHYMKNDEGELSETLWVEDNYANASAIYEMGGEFMQPGHSIETGMMLKNFKVRSESYLNALEHNIMVLISWPEEVETDVQTYDFQNFLQQMEMAEEASANNVFKLQKFNGDITFAADGTATMTLKNGKTITVSNQLSFKGNGNKQSWSRTEGNGFNWLPGNEWLNGQTKQNTHLVGYVMPEGEDTKLSYAVYPAQITDDPGNITGIDGVENDNDGVSVVDGMIKAPAGSCIFSISGANVKANQTLTGGVYVVVTPNGKVVKVLVK